MVPCCILIVQNVERIIALGAPSATELEELYKTGQLSRHEVQSRTIADRRRQAEKVSVSVLVCFQCSSCNGNGKKSALLGDGRI